MIDSFRGEYRCLSNFYPCSILYEGLVYPTTENAYQAAKTKDKELRKDFTAITPAKAKKLGNSLRLREDWEDVKIPLMEELVRQKFSKGHFKEQLDATEDEELIEGNGWNDTFWGVCNGKGQNYLGRILMQVRNENRLS